MKITLRRIVAAFIAPLIIGGSLVGVSATPAKAMPVSEHCGIAVLWSFPGVERLSKNVTLTFRGYVVNRSTTIYCVVLTRKKVTKNSYMSLAFGDHPGKYTKGKRIQRVLTIPERGITVGIRARLFKKTKIGGVKTYWASRLTRVA